MSNQESSNISSANEEKLMCPNCNTNLLRIDASKQRRMIYTVYNFNEDYFTCRGCSKVISDQEITKHLKSLLNFNY